MFPYPLKDSAKLWESDTIKTVQMKHHSEACSGPQSKDDNINALSNNNTCNYPRQLSVSYLPTVEGCTESTTKSTKQENQMHKHTQKNHSLKYQRQAKRLSKVKVMFCCIYCTSLIFNHISSLLLYQQHPDWHLILIQLVSSSVHHIDLWACGAYMDWSQQNSYFWSTEVKRSPGEYLQTAVIYIVPHNFCLQQLWG